jgi:hypothetical protein
MSCAKVTIFTAKLPRSVREPRYGALRAMPQDLSVGNRRFVGTKKEHYIDELLIAR